MSTVNLQQFICRRTNIFAQCFISNNCFGGKNQFLLKIQSDMREEEGWITGNVIYQFMPKNSVQLAKQHIKLNIIWTKLEMYCNRYCPLRAGWKGEYCLLFEQNWNRNKVIHACRYVGVGCKVLCSGRQWIMNRVGKKRWLDALGPKTG